MGEFISPEAIQLNEENLSKKKGTRFLFLFKKKVPGSFSYLKNQTKPTKILILLSGGNVDPSTYQKIWENNFLQKIPSLG